MQKGFAGLLIIILGLLIIVAIGTGAFLYFQPNIFKGKPIGSTGQSNSQPNSNINKEKPSVSAAPELPKSVFENKEFAKRLFDVDEKILNQEPLPEALLSVSDEMLVGIRCTENLRIGSDLGVVEYGDEKVIKVNDAVIHEVMRNIKNSVVPNEIADLKICETKDGERIVKYEIWGGGGGMDNKAYFGLVNSENTIEKSLTIVNDGAAYFRCHRPLQYTTSGDLYYECGGGDGPTGARSIYKVNLKDFFATRVIKCISTIDEKENPVFKCE